MGKIKVSPCFGIEKSCVGRDAIYRGRKHRIRRLVGKTLSPVLDMIGFE